MSLYITRMSQNKPGVIKYKPKAKKLVSPQKLKQTPPTPVIVSSSIQTCSIKTLGNTNDKNK